jgi:hypothetical protein
MYRENKELPATESCPQRPQVSWEVLDGFTSPHEIAAFLYAHGVKGRIRDTQQCPLARVTGWTVGLHSRSRWWWMPFGLQLTRAEKRFVKLFDMQRYPDLIGK